MTGQPRDPQQQKIDPQRQNPDQQHHAIDDPVNKPPGPGRDLETGVDTESVTPGKTQGANLA